MRVVLLVAAGAAWESAALTLLSERRDVVVLKRCVDVDDLLASATSGQADTAVVALEAPGLDLAAVDHLRRHGVRPVGVAPGGPHLDPARVRATRIGLRAVVAEDDLASLAAAVTSDEPEPAPVDAWADAPVGAPDPDLPAYDEPRARGRVIAVWGPAGAPGRTTVATALAAVLGRHHRTTLVDADPAGGSVAQVLGVLDEVSGLLSAARLAGAGMLEERFSSVQRALDGRLTVVTGLPRPDRWSEVRAGTVELIADLAAAAGHVVLDTGSSLEGAEGDQAGRAGRHQLTLSALDVADEIVLVGTPDPVGLSRLARAAVELGELHPHTPVRVVVNRMRTSIGWSERDVTQMISGFADPAGLHFLPEDQAVVDRALVTGRSLVDTAPDSALVAGVRTLAHELVGAVGEPPRRGRLRRRTAGTTRPR
ncbi:AAA family ATPase [Nocardioides flavescens]|uniref:CobQ/CobB/MinD/ParA nucleotide binding domain-containing protein n=1 Tax=Nocardioides flavescens TaxID=2691959 RepID=A0A6L7F0S3_9ACTN|nr:hypothetical protein [Nocardioides flavescens]MXG90529.1 hypothetical protein [Nocardioides flavescens]